MSTKVALAHRDDENDPALLGAILDVVMEGMRSVEAIHRHVVKRGFPDVTRGLVRRICDSGYFHAIWMEAQTDPRKYVNRRIGRNTLKALSTQERLMDLDLNDDKRTANSASQFALGMGGYSPTIRHEISATEEFAQIVKEIHGEGKPDAS